MGLGRHKVYPKFLLTYHVVRNWTAPSSNHKKKYRNIPNLTTSPIHGSKKSWRCVHFTIILCVSKVLYLVSFLSTAAIFFLLCWIVTASWKLQPFSFNCKVWILKKRRTGMLWSIGHLHYKRLRELNLLKAGVNRNFD